ncbi:MAG: alpha/beta fold hydrolase [Vannielia sp.]|uniref:alpha/beta fold hydrolase n=1 Tax=Vannielia sp. TaxID=2813045 RepID=UPI003B8E60B0
MVKITEREETVRLLRGAHVVELSVRIWEPEGSEKSLLCIHGFAANSWDFSVLAETMVKSGFTVIAPDMIGRGRSSFLGDPDAYSVRSYVTCIEAVSQFEKAEKYHLGTSWGGVILLAYLASTRWASRGIVLNDVFLESDESVTKLRGMIADEVNRAFPDRDAAEAHVLATRNLEFLEGDRREAFLDNYIMQVNGAWRLRYDPAVTAHFDTRPNFSLLGMMSQLPVPTLMAYGRNSPYANSPHLDTLSKINPRLTVLNDLDDGHPPSLMKPAQVLQIAGFLAQAHAA